MTAVGIPIPIRITTMQPPPVTILPIFLCLPLLVNGIPMDREILDFVLEIPINRFHENPPLFIFTILNDAHSQALTKSITVLICSIFINDGAWPQSLKVTSCALAPRCVICSAVPALKISEFSPRSTSVGHVMLSYIGQISMSCEIIEKLCAIEGS